SRRLRTRQDDEDLQFQNEIETTYHPPKKPRRALPEVQTVNARSIEFDSDEEYGEQAGTSFNKQGHALGRATGARRLGQGFNGRKGGNDVQQNNRSESTTSDPTAQTEIVDKKAKYRPLSPYDKSLYNEVKARMWWELGLFQNAFPSSGTSQDFMVKI